MTAIEPIHATPETRPGFIDQQSKDAIRHQLMLMADRQRALAEADELDALAHGVVALTAIRKDLDTILKDASEAAARMIFRGVEGAGEYVEDLKKYAAPGLPVLEARSGRKSSNWQSEEILSEVLAGLVREHATDKETGEVDEAARDLIHATAEELAVVAPLTTKSVQWRKPKLRDRGLDPEDYCDTKQSPPSVQIHGGDK